MQNKNKATDLARAGTGLTGPHHVLFTYDNLLSLNFLRCFMNECLRMYSPSVSVAPRECSRTSQVRAPFNH
jgi:hypothetical protein